MCSNSSLPPLTPLALGGASSNADRERELSFDLLRRAAAFLANPPTRSHISSNGSHSMPGSPNLSPVVTETETEEVIPLSQDPLKLASDAPVSSPVNIPSLKGLLGGSSSSKTSSHKCSKHKRRHKRTQSAANIPSSHATMRKVRRSSVSSVSSISAAEIAATQREHSPKSSDADTECASSPSSSTSSAASSPTSPQISHEVSSPKKVRRSFPLC